MSLGSNRCCTYEVYLIILSFREYVEINSLFSNSFSSDKCFLLKDLYNTKFSIYKHNPIKDELKQIGKRCKRSK